MIFMGTKLSLWSYPSFVYFRLVEYTQVRTENVFLKDELNRQAERHAQTNKVARLIQALGNFMNHDFFNDD